MCSEARVAQKGAIYVNTENKTHVKGLRTEADSLSPRRGL